MTNLNMIAGINKIDLTDALIAVDAARPQGNWEGARVFVIFDRRNGSVTTRTVDRDNWIDLDPSEERVATHDDRINLAAYDDYMTIAPCDETIEEINEKIEDHYYCGDEDERLEQLNDYYGTEDINDVDD